MLVKGVTFVCWTCISANCPSAKEKDNFYCQPVVLSNPSSAVPWYSSISCGNNYFAKMVPDMFKNAGVEEKKTNHSLRAAGVSQRFEAGVDEKVIQSPSGHRRLESLQSSCHATQPSVPGMLCPALSIYIKDQSASLRTLDQHVMAKTIISLRLRIWKLL